MKWLLTTPADIDVESLRREVEAAGATLETDRDPVPLDHEETVFYADGPDDLRDRLSESDMPVRVHRSSPMELY